VSSEKQILVLARRDSTEAMRVAAGLTIFGPHVDLIFMQPLSEAEADSEQAEMLELAEIVPRTTVADMQRYFEWLDAASLGTAIQRAESVISL